MGLQNGLVNTQFRRPDGTFDYDAVETMNAASTNGSKMVMSKMMNNHLWYGLLFTYTTKIGENFDFYGGIDFRYYKGLHQDVLTDLLVALILLIPIIARMLQRKIIRQWVVTPVI